MVEIALSIGIIGFALVAIMGVLPTGLQVQKTNREETLIDNDGAFYLEELRSGDFPANYWTITNAQSGVASDRGSEVAFRYWMTNEIIPIPVMEGDTNESSRQFSNNLHEVRLTFRWPVYGGARGTNIGRNRRTFRSLAAGYLLYTNPPGFTNPPGITLPLPRFVPAEFQRVP